MFSKIKAKLKGEKKSEEQTGSQKPTSEEEALARFSMIVDGDEEDADEMFAFSNNDKFERKDASTDLSKSTSSAASAASKGGFSKVGLKIDQETGEITGLEELMQSQLALSQKNGKLPEEITQKEAIAQMAQKFQQSTKPSYIVLQE